MRFNPVGWVREHPNTSYDVARYILMLAVLIGFILSFVQITHAIQEIDKNSAQIKAQNVSRARNLDKLITDNAEQTKILCALIIRNSDHFTKSERLDIQAICKQQIKDATDSENGIVSQTPDNATNTTSASSKEIPSSTKPTPKKKPTQPNNPQPKPEPQPSLLDQFEQGAGAIIDTLNPFN